MTKLKPAPKTKGNKMPTEQKLYTVIRQLDAEEDQKPDGLLFAKDKPFDDAEVTALMANTEVRNLMPASKPLLGLQYTRGDLGEHRLLVSALSYYTTSLCDKNADLVLHYEEPGQKKTKESPEIPAGMRRVDYRKTLDGCLELFRVTGCEGCPKKGLECIKLNIGYRPWPFHFAYNRREEFSAGLADTGAVEDRDAVISAVELTGADYAAVLKKLTKLSIEGFAFVDPKKTKVDNSQKSGRPLRPPKAHQFFKQAKE